VARRPDEERARDVASQRVYVGVVGLATVFLLTLLAASIFSMLGQDPRPAAPPTTVAAARRMAAEDAPKEPLAELGVAPGNAPKAPKPQPQPRHP
jgi:hypothetical protein